MQDITKQFKIYIYKRKEKHNTHIHKKVTYKQVKAKIHPLSLSLV